MIYSDLTPNQKRIICNGCGGKGSGVPIPEFLFTASCNHHDFKYWRGCTKSDRKKADRQFYDAMVQDANEAVWWKRPHYRIWARVYYQAVRMFGGKYFHYSVLPLDEVDAGREEERWNPDTH